MMKKRLSVAGTFLLMLSCQAYCGYVVGYVAGAANTSRERSTNEINSSHRYEKFDHMITCVLHYEKIEKETYSYFCPNPPDEKDVLFMSLAFNSGYYPIAIIYYMKKRTAYV